MRESYAEHSARARRHRDGDLSDMCPVHPRQAMRLIDALANTHAVHSPDAAAADLDAHEGHTDAGVLPAVGGRTRMGGRAVPQWKGVRSAAVRTARRGGGLRGGGARRL
jgi:hypothetical protein